MILTVHSKTPSVIQESPKRTSTICTTRCLVDNQPACGCSKNMATICAPTNACFSHNCPPQISIDTGMSLLASVGLFLCFPHTVWSCRVLLRPPDQSSSVTSVGIVGPHLDVNQYHTDLGLFPTDSFSIKTPFQIFFT
ncbi:hypothetical protein T4E_9368 [Trichinella pseudospiralis]|uniref:Uncharacterized protein n=1 Tax=Trichinella pseudospiralis TaxID=6337 RepID=A0A0V0YME3_TRIPS|nr:hypothetical protein T4E_9368 [Trichinella pseudospiralis]